MKAKYPKWFIADRKFFKRHPDREYRLRLAHPDEIIEMLYPVEDLRADKVICSIVQVVGRNKTTGDQMRKRILVALPSVFADSAKMLADMHLRDYGTRGIIWLPLELIGADQAEVMH